MRAGFADTRRLGARVVGDGVRFGLWAPRAERVQLVLVDWQDRQSSVFMEPESDGIWSVLVPGIGHGQRYGYRVHGAWDPAAGSRFNPERLLVDPYARAITGGIDYLGPIHDHLPGDHFAMDPTDSFGSVPLSVVIADTPPPTPIARRRSMSESVIYELHVRGFTKLHPQVPEHLRGCYGGLAYPSVAEYLRDLGVTAVQLLPIHHFLSEPFVVQRGLSNYWGYNTIGFFAPHAFYATAGTMGQQVREFKAMVSALHEADIEVILDVVYNHTAEGGHEGPTVSMRGIDHHQYYRLTNDRRDDYDVTGCGNSLDTSHPMVAQLVLDSLRYWVEEMGVDGFRFDLATTLLRDSHHHVDHNHALKQAIDSDPVLADVKLIAEPWDIGPYGYQVGAFGPRWSEWNDRFRDHVRDYWRGSVHGVRELATRLSGSPDVYDRPGRRPQASVNFVTAHDGFTMRDLVSYDVKHNLANGEANRDGTDHNRSWNHGWEGEPEKEELRRSLSLVRARQVLNMHATLALSAGVPMLVAGDEMGRTQRGNNNAYCQDTPVSWVSWDVEEPWSRVRERTSALLKLRGEHRLLRPDEFQYHQEVMNKFGEKLQRVDLTWMNGEHGQMSEGSWHDGSRRLLGMYTSDAEEAFLIWFHSGADPIEITLPGLPWASGYQVVWHSLLHEELTDEPLEAGGAFTVPAQSVVVMQADVPQTSADLLELQEIQDLLVDTASHIRV